MGLILEARNHTVFSLQPSLFLGSFRSSSAASLSEQEAKAARYSPVEGARLHSKLCPMMITQNRVKHLGLRRPYVVSERR